jgi:imidazoleglycerol-phosphate dehydratase
VTGAARPASASSTTCSTCWPATGGFEHELLEEFFRAIANNARITLHLEVQAGTNAHHMIEAAFKAFARALRAAIAIDPTERGVPSTKGTLTA